MAPGGVLVVGDAVAKAAVGDADESVRQGSEGSVVGVAVGSSLVVERSGAGAVGERGEGPLVAGVGDAGVADSAGDDDVAAARGLRVREKTIPKANGKIRSLGIPTVADRVVQSSLKLVLEPIFEADFKPCSYGFRPKRRAQDAIAEIHYLGSPPRNYEWVFEADIKACFDEIDHTALMGRVRDRIGDKRVLGWVKAFLKAGVLTEEGRNRETIAGTPQGGILSPLLANIALSVLDEHFAAKWAALGPSWTRAKRRRAGEPTTKSSATRTTSWSWSTAPAMTPKRSGAKWLRCSLRWACACRKRRRGSATSTRGSTSWDGASNAEPGEAGQASGRSTPTRRRRACSR